MNQNDCHENGLVTREQTHTKQNGSRPELPLSAMTFIRRKAQQLVGKCGITKCDREDIEQEIYLDLLQRLPKFNPDKAKLTTFVQRIAERKVVTLLRERCTEKRILLRMQKSLEEIVAQDEFGDDVTLDQTLLDNKYPASELVAEVNEVLGSLPESHRVVYGMLLENFSMTEIARRLNMPRTTLRDTIIRELREALALCLCGRNKKF